MNLRDIFRKSDIEIATECLATTIVCTNSNDGGCVIDTINFWEDVTADQLLSTFDRRVPCNRREGHFDVITSPLGKKNYVMSNSN
jgi:hypothetical protein